MKPITALLVMPREHRPAMLEELQACGIDLRTACECEEACQILAAGSPVQVVFTDVTLADGSWRDVLNGVMQSGANAEVVVCSRGVDAVLWQTVRKSGAYDLLVGPWRGEEILRVVEAAAARSYMRSLRAARAPVATYKLSHYAEVA